MQVVGVDGFKELWVAVVLENGAFSAADVVAFEEASSAFPQAAAIAVDVPIGMPREGVARAADHLAKTFVGPRRSSVFVTPPRSVLETYPYAEALARSRRVAGAGISSQSFALRAKVLAAYDIARSHPRIREFHPEVSFAALAKGPLRYGKRTWNGFAERRRLLAAAGIDLPDDLGGAGLAAPDDLLDAAAGAWTAARIAAGQACSLPEEPEYDDAGVAMAIWY